jgi:hypothetical protein
MAGWDLMLSEEWVSEALAPFKVITPDSDV